MLTDLATAESSPAAMTPYLFVGYFLHCSLRENLYCSRMFGAELT
jgi:hypothetical protein